MSRRFLPGATSFAVLTGFLVAAGVQVFTGTSTSAVTGITPAPTTAAPGLLYANHLVYEGAFQIPRGTPNDDSHSAAYGANCLSFNPAGNGGQGSLFVCGLDIAKLVGEIGIPTPKVTTQLSQLPTAPLVSNFTDVIGGKAYTIYGPNDPNASVAIGGVISYNGRLIVNAYGVFDTDAWLHPNSHFVANADIKNPQLISGPHQVGSTANPGWVAGYMTPIPAAFQSAFGGPYLAGQCCLNIIGRTSSGPTATVFNPDDIGRVNPVPAKRVLGYPGNHPTLGNWDATIAPTYSQRLYDGASRLGDAVFPENSRSVLFFGRVGTGGFCYGEMTTDPNLHQQFVGGIRQCYDPSQTGKGSSSYPYKFMVAAYDANDLIAVKNGTKQEWEVVPYTTWEFTLPIMYPTGAGAKYLLGGVAYDPATQRIFVAQKHVDMWGSSIINVFRVDTGVAAGLCR